jgi:hypothetical protein
MIIHWNYLLNSYLISLKTWVDFYMIESSDSQKIQFILVSQNQ